MILQTDWHLSASCAQSDPDIFYDNTPTVVALAVRTCAACSVREQCLEYALRRKEEFGIWGGKTPNERLAIHRMDDPNFEWPRMCKAGLHTWDERNIIVGGHGERRCGPCLRVANQRSRAKKREEYRKRKESEAREFEADSDAAERFALMDELLLDDVTA